ncbi:hypothetical protein GCM10027578_06250 [Spirosoma luteolum]
MKKTLFTLLATVTALFTLVSCEKEEDRLTLQPGGTITLTSSAQSVSLTSADAAKDAVTFSWTVPSYGFKAANAYTLQFDKKGGTFASPIEITAGSNLKQAITGADFNTMLLKLGVAPGSAGQVDVRVKSDIAGSTVPSVVSGTTTISGTPYLVVIQYPAIYVPGAYQGWAPDKAPGIVSVKDNKVYEGYIYFKDASDFKLTPARNWDNDFGSAGAGKLKAKGDNLNVASGGYYLLKADLNALTWSATKTTFGVIGAATPKGWDASTPMTYDESTGTWKVTLALKQDELKFRANDAWDINYGDDKADGLLESNGANIKVPAAGNYLVTLNLSSGGNYTYSLTKL